MASTPTAEQPVPSNNLYIIFSETVLWLNENQPNLAAILLLNPSMPQLSQQYSDDNATNSEFWEFISMSIQILS